jgi:hypothetical protein
MLEQVNYIIFCKDFHMFTIYVASVCFTFILRNSKHREARISTLLEIT